jgi:hypothetical protein
MSYLIVDEVIKHSRANKTALLVLIVLASRAKTETRVCWPSIDCLANDARLCRNAAIKALRYLQKIGEIER